MPSLPAVSFFAAASLMGFLALGGMGAAGERGGGEPVLARCVTINGVAVTMENVAEGDVGGFVRARVDAGAAERFQVFNRWTSTASNPTVFIREPFTLTYSFLNDGTVISSGPLGEPASGSNLHAVLNPLYGGNDSWKDIFRSAFDRMEELTGIRYVEVSDDGAAFPAAQGALGARGDVRIGMHPIDGASGPNFVAYTYFPNQGDMVLDSANTSTWSNPAALFNLIGHEHGHGIGYQHVFPQNQTKLMEPIIVTSFSGPQEDDIRAFQLQYGDAMESNDSVGEAVNLGELPASTDPLVITNLSLEMGSQEDWFAFAARDQARLKLRVVPVGTNYLQGPEPAPGGSETNTLVMAKSILDLAFEIRNGQQSLLVRNSAAAGFDEFIENFQLSPAAIYTIRVFSPQVTRENIQRYELHLSIDGGVGPTPTATPSPTPSPTPSLDQIACQQTVFGEISEADPFIIGFSGGGQGRGDLRRFTLHQPTTVQVSSNGGNLAVGITNDPASMYIAVAVGQAGAMLQPGTYNAAIAQRNSSQSLPISYSFTMTCDPSPTPTPTPTPSPTPDFNTAVRMILDMVPASQTGDRNFDSIVDAADAYIP